MITASIRLIEQKACSKCALDCNIVFSSQFIEHLLFKVCRVFGNRLYIVDYNRNKNMFSALKAYKKSEWS
jgi:hypothetical protein